MDKDFVLQMANTIKDQLVGHDPVECHSFMGHRKFCGNGIQGHGSPKFHVQGRLFSGNVIIAYNALDYYEVYLQNYAGTECIGEEVYFDELGRVIDEAIERGKDEAEYQRFLWKECFS